MPISWQLQSFALVGGEPGSVTSQDVFSCLQAGEAVFASGPAEGGAFSAESMGMARVGNIDDLAAEVRLSV